MNKFVLSRKGFDSANGGLPSPILPDGKLLSFPIPVKMDKDKYFNLEYNGMTYHKILSDLGATHDDINNGCHLDPDLRKECKARFPNWRPAFGQDSAASRHLINQGIAEDDIFLFFGWFRQTELAGGKLKYMKTAPDLHIVYGYLQIGAILSFDMSVTLPRWVMDHPHAMDDRRKSNLNRLYIAKDNLTIAPEFPGAGVFTYHDDLVLTKKGYPRSKWDLPRQIFDSITVTYHSPKSWKLDYFQSAHIGQEFVVHADRKALDWGLEKIRIGLSNIAVKD